MTPGALKRWLSCALLCALILGCRDRPAVGRDAGAAATGTTSASPASSVPPPYEQPATKSSPVRAAVQRPGFAELAEHADPAVVFVDTEQAVYGRGKRVVAEGLGSGFVFDPDGLILTNYHVIAHATRIDVVFGDQRRVKATVAGVDPPTDIAVLKVEEKGLRYLVFGDSDSVRVGDWVVAIGNPFGLSHTVSAGILSAKGRTRKDVQGLDPSGYYDFLQTDASINPGNSGGPLLDLSGEVIGINTAIKPQANTIGFAIPIDMVRELLPSILEFGKVKRSAIGLVVASIKTEDAVRLKLANRRGALVTRVIPGGPGDRAGIQVDDVIVGFGSASGAGPHRLRWIASIAGIGKSVALKVLRGGAVFDLAVTLGELPEPERPTELPGLVVP